MLALACVLVLCPLAQAQYRTSIQGVVADPSGAVVSGATLTLTNPATSEKLVRTTNAAGVYNFNALPAAPFRLEVEAKGFEKQVIDNLQLVPEQLNGLNIKLTVGSVTQTVTVNAANEPLLTTATANSAGVISESQIQNMPSFGRDVFQLVQLTPGVFGDGSQTVGGGNNLPGTQGPGGTGGTQGIFQTENGPQVLAHGGQYENNSYTIDGISTTSAVWGGTTIITPTEDSVDNVSVISNAYDAEYGRFSGAQVQVTSKGGSNQVHGSFFFTRHTPGLNAYQPFAGLGNTPSRDNNQFNQLGGSVGGPIWKNKVFGFFAIETIREKNSYSQGNGWYDTPDFDALASPGSIAYKYLNYAGNRVLNKGISQTANCLSVGLTEGVNCVTIPGKGLNIGTPLTTGLGTQDLTWVSTSNPGIGGGLGTTADIANYITYSPTTQKKYQYNGRVDANVTSRDAVGFMIYWVPQTNSFYNGNRGYDIFHHHQINEAYTAIWNHTFNPSFLNELRANVAGWHWNEITDNSQSPVGFPTDYIDNAGNGLNVQSFGPNVGSILKQWTYGAKDVATKIFNRHTLKFGGDYTGLYYLSNCVGCGVPNYNFFNIWDFLNDAPHNQGGAYDPHTGNPTTLRQDDREDIYGFFAQDDWKVKKNLTLNVGLRYNYFGPLWAKGNNFYRAIPGQGSAYMSGLTVVKGGNAWKSQKYDLGPQIGFSWSPTDTHDKLVIRGGYGLSYNQEEIAISANIMNNPGGWVWPTLSMSSPTAANPGINYAISSDPHSFTGYPATQAAISSFGANGLPTTGQVSVTIFPNTLPTMLTHHYSLDTQFDLGHQWMATLGYQGSLSKNTYFHSNPNARPAAEGYALNPSIGGGDNWGVNGHGNYNAMLSELKHQFSHEFMADMQFTWSKSMDTSSAPYSEQNYPYDPNLSYGPSDYNVSKAFKLYGMWQPVFFKSYSKSWIGKLGDGWSLSGIWNVHSGFPWSPYFPVQGGSLYCGTCGYGQIYPGAYLGNAGRSTSNSAYKYGTNFPLAATEGNAMAYFTAPTYTAYTGTAYGSVLPQAPGVRRNSWTGPGYKDVDMTIAKAFGLPNAPVLGENAKIEFRADIYNLFNNMNLNPTSISSNVESSNFGVATSALGARVITMTARFSF
jgi:hypothetical protein